MAAQERHPSGTIELAITGMSCGGCARAVSRVLSEVSGVDDVQVDLASGRAVVRGTVAADALVQAVEAQGYGATLA